MNFKQLFWDSIFLYDFSQARRAKWFCKDGHTWGTAHLIIEEWTECGYCGKLKYLE